MNAENKPTHTFPVSGAGAYSQGYDEVRYCQWSGIRNNQVVAASYYSEGADEIAPTVAHEIGHIFGGVDEYPKNEGGCEQDDCTKPYGYLRVNNGNCQTCNSQGVSCMMRNKYDRVCDFSLGHIGWQDSDTDGVADAIQPRNGGWQAIPNVNLGDLIRIYTLDNDFVNLISVTANNMATQPANYVIWDGHNYDNQICVIHQTYLVTINDGSPFSITLNSPNPSVKPAFSNISYADAKLSWKLTTSWAYVRCFIYDQSQNLIARPIWDKLYSANYLQTLDLVGWQPNTYTAKFYAWRPDGGASQEVSYTFVQPCTHCGDADDNGVVNISDAVKLVNYIFVLPTPFLGDCGTPSYAHGLGDADGNGLVSIADGVYLINYIFAWGPCPHCKDLPVWGLNCP